MMPSLARTLARGAPVLLALLGCGRPPFTPPSFCDSCPLPPTTPPVVHIVTPVAGDTITRFFTVIASATDDRQVTGVEFFRSFGAPDHTDWIKLHPGEVAVPPYTLDLSRYPDSLPSSDVWIHLMAVAHDVEGNADTVGVLVYYQWVAP